MSRDKNSAQNNFWKTVAEKTNLPCDLLEGEFRLELRGRGEMYLCGCKKILKYSEEEMVIRARTFDVVVQGEKLICASFHCSGIVIEGNIQSIKLENFE